jgi:hypothetical protein
LWRLCWGRLRNEQNTSCNAGEERGLALDVSKAKIQKPRRVVYVIVVVWSSDTELSFHSI